MTTVKQTTEISEYEQTAIDFLNKHGIKFSSKFIKYGRHFDDDKESRNIYRLTLSRDKNRISFRFGQSLAETENDTEPTAYALLTCLTKYEPGSFNDFCSEYGYDSDSRKAYKTYKEVCKEWQKVESFFTSEELEEIQEIN